MNKAFEKILERLEDKKYKNPIYDYEDRKNETLDDAKKIVQEVAESNNSVLCW